ncbi:MAG: efflux RND transporter periplasmic adaptor subunit [Candidatus Xenobia bacterium]
MRTKFVYTGLVALGLAALVGGCNSGAQKAGSDPPGDAINPVPAPVVSVVKPVRQNIHHTLELPGDVEAWYKAKLYAKVAGYLKTLVVDKGDHVTQGELLATIESPELERQAASADQTFEAAVAAEREDAAVLQKAMSERMVAQANYDRALAQVRESQAGIVKAKSDLALADTTYTRLKTVYDKDHGLVAREDVDVAEAQKNDAAAKVDSADEALDAAQQNVESCKSAIAAANSQINALKQRAQQDNFASAAAKAAAQKDHELYAYTDIRAPFTGLITARYLDPGALVQDSANSAQGTAQPVLALQDLNVVRVYVQVPQPDAVYLKSHQTRITLHTAEIPDRIWKGTVTRISGALSEGSRTELTEIDLSNPDQALHPGMLVSVRLDLATHRNALTIPNTAVVMEGDKRFVFTESDNKVHKVEIETGFEEPTLVEVKKGLTGSEAVVSRTQGLRDGDVVQLVKPTSSPQQAMR